MSNRPREGARIRAARSDETPTATERFLDNFGTLLQVCLIGERKAVPMEMFRRLVGPSNAERIIEEYRLACIEFFGHEHECFREKK